MYEYIPLFVLAFIWTIFATVQDFRTREIANWLTFSLIAFGLAYRAFYSLTSSTSFFLYGFGGTILFVALGYAFYYGRVFAGGDAKLLMGFGAILPFESLNNYFTVSAFFLLALFILGAFSSLLFTFFEVRKNWKSFKGEFSKRFRWIYFLPFLIVLAILFILPRGDSYFSEMFLLALLVVFPFLLVYTKAVEKSCFVRLVSPDKLMEGDWLVNDVVFGTRHIKKSVHGLTKEEIDYLRKKRKKVMIRYGVPFALSFLLALIAFSYAYFFLELGFIFS